MAEIRTNNFTSYTLGDSEILEGSLLNYAQKCLLQNELADVSIQLSELQIDMTNPLAAAQEQSYLRGQQKVLQYILDRSEKAQEAVNALNR